MRHDCDALAMTYGRRDRGVPGVERRIFNLDGARRQEMDKLHDDPSRAAEDVVEQARRQYSGEDFKEFRNRFYQEAEKGKRGGGQ